MHPPHLCTNSFASPHEVVVWQTNVTRSCALNVVGFVDLLADLNLFWNMTGVFENTRQGGRDGGPFCTSKIATLENRREGCRSRNQRAPARAIMNNIV